MRSDVKHGAQYPLFLAGECDAERHSIYIRMLTGLSTGSQSISA